VSLDQYFSSFFSQPTDKMSRISETLSTDILSKWKSTRLLEFTGVYVSKNCTGEDLNQKFGGGGVVEQKTLHVDLTRIFVKSTCSTIQLKCHDPCWFNTQCFFSITRIRVESTCVWLKKQNQQRKKNKKLSTTLVPVDLRLCVL
jgi:hypothetical protein